MSEGSPQQKRPDQRELSEKARRKKLSNLVKKGALGPKIKEGGPVKLGGKQYEPLSQEEYERLLNKPLSGEDIKDLEVLLGEMAPAERQEMLDALKDQLPQGEYERLSKEITPAAIAEQGSSTGKTEVEVKGREEEEAEEPVEVTGADEAAPKSILDMLPLDAQLEEYTNLQEAAARRALRKFAQESLQKKLKVFEDLSQAEDLDKAIAEALENGRLNAQDHLVKDLLENEPDQRKALGVFIEEIKKQQTALKQIIGYSPTPRKDFEEKSQPGGELDYFSPEERQKILEEMEKEKTEMDIEQMIKNPPEGEISRWLEERKRKIQEERERIRGAVGYAQKQRRKIATKGRWRGGEEPKARTKTKKVAPRAGEYFIEPEKISDAEEELKNREFVESLRRDPNKLRELEKDNPASTIERLKEEIRLLEWEELVGENIERVRAVQKEKVKKIKEFWFGETEEGMPIPGLVGFRDFLRKKGGPAAGFYLNTEEVAKVETALRMLQGLESGYKELEDLVKLQKEGPPER